MFRNLLIISFFVGITLITIGCCENNKQKPKIIDLEGDEGRLKVISKQKIESDSTTSAGWVFIVKDKNTGNEYMIHSGNSGSSICPLTPKEKWINTQLYMFGNKMINGLLQINGVAPCMLMAIQQTKPLIIGKKNIIRWLHLSKSLVTKMNNRITKMAKIINTFPDWAIENLAYHIKIKTKILCGIGFPANSKEGGWLSLLIGTRVVPDFTDESVYNQAYQYYIRLKKERGDINYVFLLEEMENGETEIAIKMVLAERDKSWY
jgi:hypothetical protein